ncbi:MAG TPA: preprotein translocase subunit SecA [Candidatus Paceibacterota bacterium]|nr:preprotein translocase subunit SecA [Candidatus Paceibacterota bacterium]
MPSLANIFGSANDRYVRSLRPIIDRINSLEPEFEKLSPEELKSKTEEFKQRLLGGEKLDELLPEAFAAVREASKRTLGQRHYDVQLIGGMVLHQGKIAEMRTGEGKTLVATLPTYLNALEGKGVHVVTVNDYLARRDAAWMGQIYNALGLSVGIINHMASFLYDETHVSKAEDQERDSEGGFKVLHEFLRPVSRREAYAADITYGTNNEYGFDYLRDNMAYAPAQMVQRDKESGGHHFAIVDEVDSILIDESRTPLIISAPDEDSGDLYQKFARIVPNLKEEEDYTVDIKEKAVSISEVGIEKVERLLGMKNIYDEGGMRYVHHLEQALKAQIVFQRDKDYVVKDGEVVIVDEFTGRLMPGRRWSEGLHQAVEAKEGVKIQKESKTLATITFQNYFRLYGKLAGMTGTGQTSAEEFHKVYELDVITIPTNRTAVRKDLPDRIYKTEAGKFRAIAREIKEHHEKGQPVLVGTVSIEKNEYLSLLLQREGVPHTVLNAKNQEHDAEIIAQAGRVDGVTLATNIAGRGVDIILGGNPPEDNQQARAKELGGLHVIGTERHEARRIDDQLRGRAGRQGDPGSSQFFVSTEDDLVKRFGGDRLKNIMERLGVGEDDMIENRFVSKAIEQAQARIEGYNFDIRHYVLEYDDVMNKHREAVYGLRRQLLFTDDAREIVSGYLKEFVERLIQFHVSGYEGNYEEISRAIETVAGQDLNLLSELKKLEGQETIAEFLNKYLAERYAKREAELGEQQMRLIEKLVLLRTIDELWVDHISSMEYLRDSVRLRAYGQRDPLAEYKVEAQKMFVQLMDAIKAQVVDVIFKVNVMQQPVQQVNVTEGREDVAAPGQMDKSAAEKESERVQTVNNSPEQNIGRNDPCPCGSGKKWKKCGMLNTPEHQTNMMKNTGAKREERIGG